MLKSLGNFMDPTDKSLKCVFDAGNKKIIEMTLLKNRENTDVVCVPTHHFCNLGCKMCHLTCNSLNKTSEKIDYKDFILALSLTLCKQDTNNVLKETGYESYDLMTGTRRTNKKKLLISFMGVGEPTLNLDLILEINRNIANIKRFLHYEEVGLALATMMPNDNLRKYLPILNKENVPLKIHFSLHNPIDLRRKELIPASSLSVRECFDILREYRDVISKNETIMNGFALCHKTNDLVEIHYTLIDGVNDGADELNALFKLLNEYNFTIKFIKFNPKEDMSISLKEKEWVARIQRYCNVRVKSYDPPGKAVGSSCGEFTKHYYHEEIETAKELDEFLKWKNKYQVYDE